MATTCLVLKLGDRAGGVPVLQIAASAAKTGTVSIVLLQDAVYLAERSYIVPGAEMIVCGPDARARGAVIPAGSYTVMDYTQLIGHFAEAEKVLTLN